ncbi:MAG: universal stress protein [Nitrospirae bacterium]|nr:universal stress protein [Nitrospirota bacterium]
MNTEKSIVAGIDLGPDSEKVVAYAAYMASGMGASVSLLYVLDYLLTPPPYLTSYIEDEKKREEAELSRWKDLLTASGLKTDSRIVVGRLHESFTGVIEEKRPDLLVIGFRSHMFRPSSSERLIMSLRAPMLVVRTRSDAPPVRIGSVRIRKILCPVDFSEHSKKAVSFACSYASVYGAGLTLINVIPSHIIKERLSLWNRMDDRDLERFDDLMRAESEAAISSLSRECGTEGDTEVLEGSPGEMISKFASERSFDLIVIGARGLSYLESILIGSTTEHVLKTSPCPVLVVH